MFPILQLGPLAIQTPGLFLLLSVWIGLSLAGKRAHWHSLDSEKLDNLVLAALAGFVLGGRFFYAAAHWSAFASSPLDIQASLVCSVERTRWPVRADWIAITAVS